MNKIIAVATVLALIAFAVGAQQNGDASEPLLNGPLMIEMNPSGIAPLGGLVTFKTDEPVRVTFEINDGEHESAVTPVDAFNTEHELMLLGLRPNRTHRIDVIFETMDGGTGFATNFSVKTEPLPHWMPKIETRVSQPDRMEPGVTLFSVFNFNVREQVFTIGLDAAGDVVWYRGDSMDEPRRMRNGNLLGLGGSQNTAIEIDMLGRTVRQWQGTGTSLNVPEGVIPVAADTFHHDITEMPSGNFLAISTEIRTLEDFAEEYAVDPPRGTHEIIADRVIEFRPEDGVIVRDWKMADIYDTRRPVIRPLESFFYGVYDNIRDEPLSDWTHTNGFNYQPESDSLIMSIRKMNAIVKLDLATSQLRWILGTDWNWQPQFQELLLEPIGDTSFTFGQHAPEITPSGTLIVFDNGSVGRAFPGDPNFRFPMPNFADSYSRAVEYEIDEEAGTVREVWSYGGPGSEWFYSDFVSEADRLPITGNTLIHAGGNIVTPDGAPTANNQVGRTWVFLREVTTSGDTVWEVVIDDPMREWASYRSQRLPSLYP